MGEREKGNTETISNLRLHGVNTHPFSLKAQRQMSAGKKKITTNTNLYCSLKKKNTFGLNF